MSPDSLPLSNNFGALIEFLLQDSQQHSSAAIDQFSAAERTYDSNPVGALTSVRAALEQVTRVLMARYQLKEPETREGAQAQRLRMLVDYFGRKNNALAKRALESLRDAHRRVAPLIHIEERTAASPSQTLKQLEKVHEALILLAEAVHPGRQESWPAFVAPRSDRDLLQQSEHQLERSATRAEETEADKQKALADVQTEKKARSELEAEIVALKREQDSLCLQIRNGPSDRGVAALLQRSEARARDLQERLDSADTLLSEAESKADGAEREAKQATEDLDRVKSASAVLLHEHTRTHRYPDEYPGLDGAAAFFRESLTAPDGPLAPFHRLGSLAALPSDRYADRWTGRDGEALVLIRVMRLDPPCGRGELLEAWRREARNGTKLPFCAARDFLAAIRDFGHDPRIGFSVSALPERAQSLSEFGFGSDTLNPALAAKVSRALWIALDATRDGDLECSWPDVDSVVIHHDRAIVLEPCATHFGDLGPIELVGQSMELRERLTAPRMRAGFAHVAANAFLRLAGIALPGSRPIQLGSGLVVSTALEDACTHFDNACNDADIAALAEALQLALAWDDSTPSTVAHLRDALNSLARS